MSDVESEPAQRQTETDGIPSQGPNLTLIYSFLAIALAAAIGLALMIVLPFYHRR
jgi:hypothetical protein